MWPKKRSTMSGNPLPEIEQQRVNQSIHQTELGFFYSKNEMVALDEEYQAKAAYYKLQKAIYESIYAECFGSHDVAHAETASQRVQDAFNAFDFKSTVSTQEESCPTAKDAEPKQADKGFTARPVAEDGANNNQCKPSDLQNDTPVQLVDVYPPFELPELKASLGRDYVVDSFIRYVARHVAQQSSFPVAISKDGDMWRALIGNGPIYGIAGFGKTISEALQALSEKVKGAG